MICAVDKGIAAGCRMPDADDDDYVQFLHCVQNVFRGVVTRVLSIDFDFVSIATDRPPDRSARTGHSQALKIRPTKPEVAIGDRRCLFPTPDGRPRHI